MMYLSINDVVAAKSHLKKLDFFSSTQKLSSYFLHFKFSFMDSSL